LKKVQAADTKREMDQQELLKAIREGKTTSSASTTVQILPPLDHSALPALQTFPDVTPSTTSTTSPKRASALAIPAQAPLTHSRVSGALHALRTHENALDAARDMADLRSLLCIALQAPNDSDMIAVLQVGREEMPEAIKALQRALEREAKIAAAATADAAGVSAAQRVSVRVSGLPRPERKGTVGSVASVGSSSGGSGSAKDGARRRNDMLDREFMEMGIDALRRISLSRGMKVGELPSWTITRYAPRRVFGQLI
jgi:abelson tyrosine-protein kinase 1